MAPLNEIINNLSLKGYFYQNSNKSYNTKLLRKCVIGIITLYAEIMYGHFDSYSCTENFRQIKSIITLLRKSYLFVLAQKYNKSKHWSKINFGSSCQFVN